MFDRFRPSRSFYVFAFFGFIFLLMASTPAVASGHAYITRCPDMTLSCVPPPVPEGQPVTVYVMGTPGFSGQYRIVEMGDTGSDPNNDQEALAGGFDQCRTIDITGTDPQLIASVPLTFFGQGFHTFVADFTACGSGASTFPFLIISVQVGPPPTPTPTATPTPQPTPVLVDPVAAQLVHG